jgi:hypothetical protein
MFGRERFSVEAEIVDVCPPRPARIKDYTSAVSARGTVEMLSAPEWVKVSTDRPSQLYSLCLLDKYGRYAVEFCNREDFDKLVRHRPACSTFLVEWLLASVLGAGLSTFCRQMEGIAALAGC